jgi:hypothetical protein
LLAIILLHPGRTPAEEIMNLVIGARNDPEAEVVPLSGAVFYRIARSSARAGLANAQPVTVDPF